MCKFLGESPGLRDILGIEMVLRRFFSAAFDFAAFLKGEGAVYMGSLGILFRDPSGILRYLRFFERCTKFLKMSESSVFRTYCLEE